MDLSKVTLRGTHIKMSFMTPIFKPLILNLGHATLALCLYAPAKTPASGFLLCWDATG